jgi:hypothetical protein
LGLVAAGTLVASLAILFLPVWAMLAAIAAKPIVDLFWSTELGSFMGSRLNIQAIVGIGVPIAVLARLFNDRNRAPSGPIFVLASVYGLILAFGVLVSPSRGAALADFCRIGLPIAFLMSGHAIGAKRISPVPVGALLAAYAIVPVFAALIELLGILPASAEGVASAGSILRVRGLYQHPLDIAMRCSMAAPFALLTWRSVGPRFEKWIAASWAIAVSVLAAGTLVRSAVVATAIQLVTWLWLSGLKRYAALVPIIAVSLGLGWGPLRQVVANAIEPLQQGAAYRFGSGRTLILLAQIAGFQKASLLQKVAGRGLHTSAAVSLEYSPAPDINPLSLDFDEGKITAHNQIMRILTESGLIGLVAFTALVVAIWREFLLHLRRSMEPSQKAFLVSALASLAAVCIYSISATPLDVPAVSWPLWLAIGTAWGYCSLYPTPARVAGKRSRAGSA